MRPIREMTTILVLVAISAVSLPSAHAQPDYNCVINGLQCEYLTTLTLEKQTQRISYPFIIVNQQEFQTF